MKVEYCKNCFYYNESIIRTKIENNDDIPLYNIKISKCNGNHLREPKRKLIKIPFLRLTRINLVKRKRVKICYFHCTEIYKIKYCIDKKGYCKEPLIRINCRITIKTIKQMVKDNKSFIDVDKYIRENVF